LPKQGQKAQEWKKDCQEFNPGEKIKVKKEYLQGTNERTPLGLKEK